MNWLFELWESLTLARVGIGLGLFVLSVVLSALLVGIVLVKVPANYFASDYHREFLPNSSWLTRWGAVIAKNIAGVILILAGIVMLIGPGQGILTILIGLVLLDIPGKRPMEARIIKRPAVLVAINKLRAKYNKPPLELDD
jgi:hypothetical protein